MRIVLSNAWWPMCVGKYLLRAAKRAGHEVRTVGPTSGDRIDVWEVPIDLPGEGVQPDITGMGQKPIEEAVADERKLAEFADWADLWLDVDGGWFIYARIPTRRRVLVATDPHVNWVERFSYAEQRRLVDETYTMQSNYLPGAKWLPYAYDPEWFWPEAVERTCDVTNLGASYPDRCDISDELDRRGVRVLGPGRTCIGDAHRRQLCSAPVAMVWPLSDDLPCRVFEALACERLVVTKPNPELARLGLAHCVVDAKTRAEAITRGVGRDPRGHVAREAAHVGRAAAATHRRPELAMNEPASDWETRSGVKCCPVCGDPVHAHEGQGCLAPRPGQAAGQKCCPCRLDKGHALVAWQTAQSKEAK